MGERIEGRRFLVRGRVQGVGFRWWTEREARRLGVRGTVRNRSDGAVEVYAVASPGVLDRFGGALADGPPAARVDGVEWGQWAPEADPEGFLILR